MKFSIAKDDFKQIVKNVIPAVTDGGVKFSSALSCIKIDLLPDGVALTAADEYMMLKSVAAAKVSAKDGVTAVCVAGKALAEVVSILKDDKVTVSLSGNRLQIRTDRSAVHLNTRPAEDFSPVPHYENMQYQVAGGFLETVSLVSFAASRSAERAILHGIYITDTEMVAIDGHRLALTPHSLPLGANVLIPVEALSRLQRVFGEPQLGVNVDGRLLHFHCKNKMGSVKLMEGPFPDYKKVIPSGDCATARVGRKDLLDAIDLITVVADDQLAAKFEFGELLTVSAASGEKGEAVCRIPYGGEPINYSVSLNAGYVKQVLSLMTSENVDFELRAGQNGPLPVILKSGGYLHVIMPRRC